MSNTPHHYNQLQMSTLLSKISKLQAKNEKAKLLIDSLQFNKQDIQGQLANMKQKFIIANEIKQKHEETIKQLQAQLSARKKSSQQLINELRTQNTIVKDKNINLVQIVKYLQNEIQTLKNKSVSQISENQSLKYKVDQLTLETDQLRTKNAKFEVEVQKYKLKALEGQKYWAAKLQGINKKNKEQTYFKEKALQEKWKSQIYSTKAQLLSSQKFVSMKNRQIQELQDRIQKLIVLQK